MRRALDLAATIIERAEESPLLPMGSGLFAVILCIIQIAS